VEKTYPLVSIISINYNYADATTEMLDSVVENSYPNLEVIVVDNASTKPGFDELPKKYPYENFQFVKSETNLGFAGGNNFGYQYASGDYTIFLNNDAVLTDGCLEKMVETLESNPKLGLVSPIILNTKKVSSDPDIVQYAGTTPVHRVTGRNKTIGENEPLANKHLVKETAYAHGCAMMAPRSVIEKAGLIPEVFFLYYEELDWCERIKDAGFEIGLVPEARVYHHESLTIGQDSPLKTYYINRSRTLFMRRNSSTFQFLGCFLFMLFFTIPKNSIKFALKLQWANFKAYWNAIIWNVKDSFKSNQPTTTSHIRELEINKQV